MPDVITDRKLTQSQAQKMIAPMELDLTALFKIIQEDFVTGIVGFKGTPEEYIDKIMKTLTPEGEVGEKAIMKTMISSIEEVLKGKALPPGTRRKRSDGIYVNIYFEKLKEKYSSIDIELQEVNKIKRKTIRGYLSPEPGNITEHENNILSETYASARESGNNKERSAQIAWAAVKRYREGNKTMPENKEVEKVCKPKSGEKQNEFISRCIREQRHKGKNEDEAQGMCYGIWRGEKTKEKKQLIFRALNVIGKSIISFLKK